MVARAVPTETHTVLGQGATFDGKLVFQGTVQIDGHLNGEVRSDDTLVIGESAQLEAEIHVGTIVIFGHVKGNIKANIAVELKSTGHLEGNISSPSVQIDKGAIFDGACVMKGKEKKEITHSSQPARRHLQSADIQADMPFILEMPKRGND